MNKNPLTGKKLKDLDKDREKLYKKSSRVLPFAILLPILLTFLCFLVIPDSTIFFGVFTLILSVIAYTTIINSPFDDLKDNVREYLLEEFMKVYHPNISYRYQRKENQVKQFIESSKMVSCNRYHEEDVISGTANKINFYLSEIKLQTKSGKSTTTDFKGILFKIKIPGRRFPRGQIQSRPGLLKKMFGSFKENRLFGFWFDTENEEKFKKELNPFFPFIRYLIQQQKDIRISTNGGDNITILMKSDMKFLDDPKPQLNRSFKDETYYKKIGQQINSLLFIVEAFAGKLDKEEVVEKLELKELDYERLKVNFKEPLGGMSNE